MPGVKMKTSNIVNETVINDTIKRNSGNDLRKFDEIIQKSLKMSGISFEEVAFLLNVTDENLINKLTAAAVKVKEAIYGKRIVLFAPLYTSSYCSNECKYCGFKTTLGISRKRLTNDEIKRDTEALINMGHKRILMVAAEDPLLSASTLAGQIETIYSIKHLNGQIRRVNVNVAPMSVEDFRILKRAGIGTYQCFQETYHRDTYSEMHLRGSKSDYDNRIHVFDRCIEAGIDDFGMGFLFGLYDVKFEVLALLQHVKFLEDRFGIGPHTISIPRLESAEGSDISKVSPFLVNDTDFIKITAILRLAVPYTGIILSTRENQVMRNRLLDVGVSQLSAGSITNPGGYSEEKSSKVKELDGAQFEVHDQRSLDEMIYHACLSGFIPSFCTGCYRKGRTGEVFQDMAKEKHIGSYCSMNAILTLQEYVEDYASPQTRKAAEKTISEQLSVLEENENKKSLIEKLSRIKSGQRDLMY
ncbi:MAG: [FeFe] hydrogenase H-cluster radical SAM maturase HydG [Candidatus Riflebacteria bacterium]|nr:[FeFe] hydrogenase H-cluster radical SAM maturase HydG [Candidatus Riflebacteria bacterium]